MAPTKKTKKTADSINSRLALVLKSGKGSNFLLEHRNATIMLTGLEIPCSHAGLQVHA